MQRKREIPGHLRIIRRGGELLFPQLEQTARRDFRRGIESCRRKRIACAGERELQRQSHLRIVRRALQHRLERFPAFAEQRRGLHGRAAAGERLRLLGELVGPLATGIEVLRIACHQRRGGLGGALARRLRLAGLAHLVVQTGHAGLHGGKQGTDLRHVGFAPRGLDQAAFDLGVDPSAASRLPCLSNNSASALRAATCSRRYRQSSGLRLDKSPAMVLARLPCATASVIPF